MNEALCYEHIPSWRERLWRKLGFTFHLGDEPADVDALQGWSKTDTHIHFGFVDRLRLLATGTLRMSTVLYFDTPSPSVIKNRFDWQIVPPSTG